MEPNHPRVVADSEDLGVEFEETEELAVPPEEEWDAYAIKNPQDANRAIRLLRRMRRNRTQVEGDAAVERAKVARFAATKMAEIDQWVADRLGRQDRAEPWAASVIIGHAARELDARLEENPKASKTVQYLGGRVASRAVGGQPDPDSSDDDARSEWFSWAIDHDEIDADRSHVIFQWDTVAQIDSLLTRMSADAIARIEEIEQMGEPANGPFLGERSALQATRAAIEAEQVTIANAQFRAGKLRTKGWPDRYRWIPAQPEQAADPMTGEGGSPFVAAHWLPIGVLDPQPVPEAIGRVAPSRNYDLVVDED